MALDLFYLCEVRKMKKANITIAYEEEKLSALRLYLEQKGTTIEKELVLACENLYSKTVPNNVRDFIELRAGIQKPTEKKKQPKSKAPAITESVQDGSEVN